MDVEKEAGIALYDLEFKAGRGEIEVAEDGTVMDIATIVALKDIPKPGRGSDPEGGRRGQGRAAREVRDPGRDQEERREGHDRQARGPEVRL